MTDVSRVSRDGVRPTVSVVMITYNHAPYIAEAIEGVVRQKVDFPFELIVADDASPDGTGAIVRGYHARYPDLIRVVGSPANVGAWANHRRALARASGEFVAYCEGDDYWCDDQKLQKQVQFLRSHPSCGMVHSEFHRREGDRITERVHAAEGRVIRTGRSYEQLLRHEHYAITCSVCYRRDILMAYLDSPYDDPSLLMGDLPVILFTAKDWDIGYIDEPLAVYRRIPGSITNSGPDKTLAWVQSLAKCRQMFLDRVPCSVRLRHDVERESQSAVFRAAYAARDAQACREAFRRLRDVDPSWGSLRDRAKIFLVSGRVTSALLGRWWAVRRALRNAIRFRLGKP